ncbi:MAG: dTDP-glucose 4,6-dehydratase [SAR324 cluster bacterium]|nr:dTDP-glucose 4,6-dehydratase [SAR324 cluster bacterium]
MITGGAGFIGANLVLHWLRNHPDDVVINFDALTYAGNLENLQEVKTHPNYRFVLGDLRNPLEISKTFSEHKIDAVIHLAAESHVDRSIHGPADFIETNITGTFNLLETARNYWSANLSVHRFLHVSTDEVYGSLGSEGKFLESTAYAPNSPYSASKAASDHLVRSWRHTYKMNVVTTNCSNNYGPFQFPEKLLPLLIHNCTQDIPIPVYGDGKNIRDWLFVEDHCEALDCVFHEGDPGEVFNIGGENEWENIDIIRFVCRKLDKELGKSGNESCGNLITFVKDRPGHDRRYAIDATKIKTALNWTPRHSFEEGLTKTIRWYLDHQEWVSNITSGTYQDYYVRQYG